MFHGCIYRTSVIHSDRELQKCGNVHIRVLVRTGGNVHIRVLVRTGGNMHIRVLVRTAMLPLLTGPRISDTPGTLQ